jgi:sugar phosphate isomerase/epimerase
MQLALSGRSLGVTHPLDEDIRIAAITGYPWLVIDDEKYRSYLNVPDFDIRDLKRLFLRTQPAALDGLHLPDCDPIHAPEVEAIAKEARRVGAPVVVLRVTQPDERIMAYAEIAQRWSTVLALGPSREVGAATFDTIRRVVRAINHDALGWYVDAVAIWQAGEALQPEDAARAVLLAIGDRDRMGEPVLPGGGTAPLVSLLQPLVAGGYDGLAVLDLVGMDTLDNTEALAGAGLKALREVVTAAGWTVQP